jgi:hypothetical protein
MDAVLNLHNNFFRAILLPYFFLDQKQKLRNKVLLQCNPMQSQDHKWIFVKDRNEIE